MFSFERNGSFDWTIVYTMITYNGYKLKKTPERLKKVKKDLIVEAEIKYMKELAQPRPFPVFRMNSVSLYVPKFYGLETFGHHVLRNEREGVNVQLSFRGKLNEMQRKITSDVVKTMNEKDSCILSVGCGQGKCLGKDQKVLMYNGSLKKVQFVEKGDLLMGDDNTPRKVLSTCKGYEQLYTVKSGDDVYIVNQSHILSFYDIRNRTFTDLSIRTYFDSYTQSELRLYKTSVEFPYTKPFIDPYMFGLLVANGYESFVNPLVIIHESIIDQLSKEYYQLGYTLHFVDRNLYEIEGIQRVLDMEELTLCDKLVPRCYITNAYSVRIKFLAGVFEYEWMKNNEWCFFSSTLRQLVEDVYFTLKSVGLGAYYKKVNGVYTIYTKRVRLTDCIPFKSHSGVDIEYRRRINLYKPEVGTYKYGKYYGFELDGNHRFVLGSYDVTHNTVMALWIIAQFRLKTLIVVHKDFLFHQWVERIQQFIPSARIGKIRRDEVCVENTDIVIAMLQSLTVRKKGYDDKIFESFGNLVIDECHNICTKTFSKAFFQISTKKSLGLSATPYRKDGLTKVLEWFLGSILTFETCTKEQISPKIVCVKAAYEKEFTPQRNYLGKINLPLLITQITRDTKRNRLLLNIVRKCMVNNRKVLLLTDRRTHCEFLQSELGTERTGMYIGGMKKDQLEKTNTKDVILATYSMAKEGYDCPSLDTLILATSRSDIEQSIGRILRRKNKYIPMVFDVQDSIEGFKTQVYARKRYYRKCGYVIVEPGKSPSTSSTKKYAFVTENEKSRNNID